MGIAVSCGVGQSRASDPTCLGLWLWLWLWLGIWLWLWLWLAAVAPIPPLPGNFHMRWVWTLQCKKQTNKQTNKKNLTQTQEIIEKLLAMRKTWKTRAAQFSTEVLA